MIETTEKAPASITDTSFEEVSAPSPEIVSLLERTLWGTDEALYTMHNIRGTLAHLPKPKYLLLKKRGRLIGVRILLEKFIWLSGRWQPAVYHSFFAIEPSEKGRGFGKYLAEEVLRRYQGSEMQKRPLYAFVEAGNHRSRHISESLGYQRIRDFHTIFFSRFEPQSRLPAGRKVRRLQPFEVSLLSDLLKKRYSGHSLFEWDPALRQRDYYVLQEGETIVAGVQSDCQRWKIRHLAGLGGIIARRLLPQIAPLRRLFNPNDFQFLKFGHLYAKEGNETALLELMEAVLAAHGLCTGMTYLDTESPVDKRLLSAGSWGLMRSLLDTTVHVMANLPGFSDDQIAELRRTPVVLSPNDA